MAKHKFVEQTSYDNRGRKQTLRINARKTPAQVREQVERINDRLMEQGKFAPESAFDRKVMLAEDIEDKAKDANKPISSQVAHINKKMKSYVKSWNAMGDNLPKDEGMLTKAKAAGGNG